jgi:hypothetical protein
MRTATIGAALTLWLASAGALAQDAGDVTEKLRACSQLANPERLECLEKLSRDIGPPSPPRPAVSSVPVVPPAASNWIVSETASPIDYTPVAIATASSSKGPDDPTMRLSIQCRGGRTDLVIDSPSLTHRVEEYVVSYGVNEAKPVVLVVNAAASGTGVAIMGDVVRLLASLPAKGEITFRVTDRQGGTLEGRYALDGLKVLLGRLAIPCKWPAGAGAPRNR